MERTDSERLERMEVLLERLDHSLNGNGQPGFIAESNKRIGELEKGAVAIKTVGSIIVAILTATGGALISHLWKGGR